MKTAEILRSRAMLAIFWASSIALSRPGFPSKSMFAFPSVNTAITGVLPFCRERSAILSAFSKPDAKGVPPPAAKEDKFFFA